MAGLLEELQFAKYRSYRIEELSGGTRQKLNLALALIHDPELLLLDEPYAGFDWETYLHFCGGFSESFHAGGELLLSLGWLAVLGAAVYLVLRRAVEVRS